MSEYQYYEFLAIDRILDAAARDELRAMSSRARITATSFTNHYEWGDFRGDPLQLMQRWFDLHVYVANWGARRLMIRLPKQALDPADVAPLLKGIAEVQLKVYGDDVIVDINLYELESEDGDDGLHWMAALAPLRSDLLAGDRRLFYLIWLMAVGGDLVPDDAREPMSGIGPLNAALTSFAEFLMVDPDLLTAAAEQKAPLIIPTSDEIRAAIEAVPDVEKVDLLLRVSQGDAHVVAELRRRLPKVVAASGPQRTAGALRARAKELEDAREQAEAREREAARRRQAEQDEKARQVRIKALARRGDAAWDEVESEIERRNAPGYDRAAALIADLRGLALQTKQTAAFDQRVARIRARHESKRKFIERLDQIGK